MTTYPSPLSTAPALTDEATLEVALDCLQQHLPIQMEGGYRPQELFELLLRAASRGDSIEQTARQLQGVPSSNAIRYHLDKLNDMETLEQQLNQALQSRIPAKIRKAKHRIAIDLHLIPYYGNPSQVEAAYLYRSQAKAGTTRFFAYATVYLISRNKRLTLGIHAVHRQETKVCNRDDSTGSAASAADSSQMSLSRPGLLQCASDSLAQSTQHPIYPACGDSGQNRGDSCFAQRPQELCHPLQPQQSTAWDGELPDAGGLSVSQRPPRSAWSAVPSLCCPSGQSGPASAL